ncbi:hypothetical protein [Dyella flagellata]|uniref:hypothetical protein n=1 Tax=Dyella flagellata TaxID=1867833 RepID=UPI0024E060DA|nr:hypothetical protein [Dyella flagellata]
MKSLKRVGVVRTLYVFFWTLTLAIVIGMPHSVIASDTENNVSINTICRDWPMPTGYVIVSVRYSQSCLGTGQGIEYSVSPASEGMTVCNNLSIPAPYVITTMAPSSKCAGLFEEGVIRTVANGMSVCGNGFSPIPEGYIVTAVSSSDRLTCHGVPIYRVSTVVNGAAICNVSPKPAGYVISRVISNGQCLGSNAYVLQIVSEGVIGCSFSPLPGGYVVTAGQQTNSCTDGGLRGDYWTFNQPFNGINVCPFSPIPAGYYITGQVPRANCFGANFGFILKRL